MQSAKAGMLRGVSELEVWPLNYFGCCGNSQPFGSILPSPAQSLEAPVIVDGHVHITGRGPHARQRYTLDVSRYLYGCGPHFCLSGAAELICFMFFTNYPILWGGLSPC